MEAVQRAAVNPQASTIVGMPATLVSPRHADFERVFAADGSAKPPAGPQSITRSAYAVDWPAAAAAAASPRYGIGAGDSPRHHSHFIIGNMKLRPGVRTGWFPVDGAWRMEEPAKRRF